MARVIFMCGPSGSGKSTHARRLESDGMVRLSFDAEAWRRGVTTAPAPREVLAEIERDLRGRLLALAAAGRDVVLDFPFSTREMRDAYRELLEPLGVVPETVYLATDRDTVARRLRARHNDHADGLALDEELALRHYDQFEAPTPEEGPLRVIVVDRADSGSDEPPA